MSMKSHVIPSKPKTYFTISHNQAGFTDQLVDFGIYYKLGRSLGFQYLHTSFHSSRSSLPPITLGRSSPLFTSQLWNKIYQKLYREFHHYWNQIQATSHPTPYDFLGFNVYLAGKTPQNLARENLENIDVPLGDVALLDNGISTFARIQQFVSDSVSRKFGGKREILVTFSTPPPHFPILLGEIIHSNIPEFQDGLDLIESYSEARKKRPWKSKFEENKVKILVHIRQGDVAVIETPWNTFIPVWLKKLVEYNKFSDIQYDNRVFQIDDYYLFIKRVLANFYGTKFSSLFFSDGFKRAFSLFSSDSLKSLSLTKDQVKRLIKSEETYDEKAFHRLTKITGSTLVLGEEPQKLCELIHSILVADVIIIGPRAAMVPKLLASYRHADNMPLIIVLHKGTTPPFAHTDFLGLHAKAKNFIYVNILEDNDELVLSELTERVAKHQSTLEHSQKVEEIMLI